MSLGHEIQAGFAFKTIRFGIQGPTHQAIATNKNKLDEMLFS